MSALDHNERTQQLATGLRSVAARAADAVGGGCALLFATTEVAESDAPVRLRAAAGFESAEAARGAATAAETAVRQVLATRTPQTTAIAELGVRASGGVCVLPVLFRETIYGALLVGAPASGKPDPNALTPLADEAAIRIDHARMAARLESATDIGGGGEADGDELLRLSEQLFAQDIELLRNNEKLGKIEKLKNDFIEKMSRELRTPMNSIIEAIIGVLAGENEAISELSKETLRQALTEGTAFQRTLENILDLWRIKQNELPVETHEVNLSEVIDEAIFSVQDTLGEKPVRIVKQVQPSLPKIRTDLAKINQILFQLLDNAAKFTDRGTIEVKAGLDGDHFTYTIEDTGIGICGDDLEFVFDEFFQVDELSPDGYRGAGLGLSLVRDLVVLLGGEIEMDSEAGSGTRVWLRIPVQTNPTL